MYIIKMAIIILMDKYYQHDPGFFGIQKNNCVFNQSLSCNSWNKLFLIDTENILLYCLLYSTNYVCNP